MMQTIEESTASQILHWIIGGLAAVCSAFATIIFGSITGRLRNLEKGRREADIVLTRVETKVDLLLKHFVKGE